MFKKLIAATAMSALLSGAAFADTTLKLVEVITSPERTETLKGIVADFESANPGAKVEIISLPWGEAFEKFATMVSAGETPDVDHVLRALGNLEDDLRLPCLLYYVEHKSVDEIAEALSLPRTTVKWRLHQARAELRARLKEIEK